MSHKATEWAWTIKLKPAEKLVLLRLADRSNPAHGDKCYTSITRLAQDAGLSKRAVIYSTAKLIEKGLIECEPGDRIKANTYRVLVGSAIRAVAQGVHQGSANGDKEVVQTATKGSAQVAHQSYENRKSTTVNEPEPLPQWINQAAWDGWLELRKKKGVPMTPRARTLAINQLAKFMNQGHDPNEIIDKCVMNGWHGIYLPRDMEHKPKKVSLADQLGIIEPRRVINTTIREIK